MDHRLCGRTILVPDGVTACLFHRGLPSRKRKILTGNLSTRQWYLKLTYLSGHLIIWICHIFVLIDFQYSNRGHWLIMSGVVYARWFWPERMYVWQFFKVQVGIQSPDGISTLRQTLRRFSDFLKLYAAVGYWAGAFVRKLRILPTSVYVVFLYLPDEQLLQKAILPAWSF